MDEIEDSVEGACPLSLDLSKLDMTRVTSRIYGCTWLETLDLSSNRLNRVSPDISAMDSLVDVNLRHNRLAMTGGFGGESMSLGYERGAFDD